MSILSNDILTALVQGAPDAMIVVDGTGTIVFANRQLSALFGYRFEEIVGQKVECLVPEQIREAHIGHRTGFMRSPAVRSMGTNLELAGCKKSGENFPIEISLSPLKTEEGLFAIAAIRDVTEKKQKEKKLVAANAALERFVYVASHDLQEPLRSLQQLVEMLRDKIQDYLGEEESNLITRISSSSSRMSLMIKDLLDFSRIGAKRELKITDCNLLVNELQINLEALIRSTGAQIVVKNVLPVLNTYVSEFRLLFQNLIVNAIKFCRKGVNPIITIDVKNEKTHWLFSVADNGIGIESKFFNKLFVVFQRLHNRDEYPGNGIGLAHCKRVVELHEGNIWIESEVGKGTTFCFTIPCNLKEMA